MFSGILETIDQPMAIIPSKIDHTPCSLSCWPATWFKNIKLIWKSEKSWLTFKKKIQTILHVESNRFCTSVYAWQNALKMPTMKSFSILQVPNDLEMLTCVLSGFLPPVLTQPAKLALSALRYSFFESHSMLYAHARWIQGPSDCVRAQWGVDQWCSRLERKTRNECYWNGN